MTSILISGAGIAGPTLAWWLLNHGFQPTIVERAPAFREGGYVIDFWGVGFDVAEKMMLLPRLRELGYRMDRLCFLKANGGTRSELKPRTLLSALGNRFLSIQRGDLARAIFDLVQGRAEMLFGDSIATLQPDPEGVEVSFSSGRTGRFDLVIGADGLHSTVRSLAFAGSGTVERYLGFVAAAFSDDGYPKREEHTYVSFAEPGRQMSRYAVRNDRTVFLLIAARKMLPEAILDHHDPRAPKRWLRAAFQGCAWIEAGDILSRLEYATDLYCDAVSQVVLPTWSSGRVALLGDAAYGPSLLSGQGSSFAMLGAYLLAKELVAAGGAPSAFAAYERQLRPFIEKKQRAARSFASSFTPASEFGLFVRDQVMHLMNLPGFGPWVARRMFKDEFVVPSTT